MTRKESPDGAGTASRPADARPTGRSASVLPRLTRKVFWDLAIYMVCLGLLVAVVFPPSIVLLGVPAAQAFRVRFMLACLVGGFVVGALNYLLARAVVGRRLRVLSARFVSTSVAIRQATSAGEWAEGPPTASVIAVDSDDELGETAASFNSLLEALAHERGYRALLYSTSDLVMVTDPSGTVRWATPSARSVLGYEPVELAGRALEELLHDSDAARARSEIARVAAGTGRASRTFDVRLLRRDGSWGHFETVATNLLADPRVAGLALSSRDITERVGLEDELRHQAFHDALTGLANRALFVDRLEHALARRDAPGDRFAVALRRPGRLQDPERLARPRGGRRASGRGRRAPARLHTPRRHGRASRRRRVRRAARGPGRGRAARRGRRASRRDASRARSGRGPRRRRERQRRIVRATPGDTADVLVRNADLAMYAAKRLGKGTSMRYDPGMHVDALDPARAEGRPRAGAPPPGSSRSATSRSSR